MRERDIETYFVKRVKDEGGIAYKFTSPARRSVPDRLVVHARGVFFVELKAPGEKPTDAQLREHKRLRSYGAHVSVVASRDEVDCWVAEHLGS